MKTIPLLLCILSFTSTELLVQKQKSPQAKAQTQVLFDFRVQRTSAPAKISLATQRNVLSKVFRKYLSDESQCNPEFNASSDTDPLKAARNAGQIVPSIFDVARGSFTAPGRQETAYVISVSECNASHADNFGTKRVAIFAGQQLIADVDADFKGSIALKMDLNGDGMEELLMTSGDMHQGVLTEMGVLVDFQNGRIRVIEDLGMVTEDSCASGIADSSSKAAVVSLVDVVPGKMPRLRIDNYEARCRNAKRWRFVSTGKMQE